MRPAGDLTIFTLFPWAGFVFAGGAVGALLAAARDERAERRLHVDPRRDRRGAHRVRVLHRRPAVDLPRLVVLDQLADVVRDPRRDPDDRAVGDLRVRWSSSRNRDTRSTLRAVVAIAARPARPQLAVHLLDPRGAGLRLRELAVAQPAAALGHGRRVRRCSASLMYGAIGWRDRLVDGWRIRPAPSDAPQTATA